MAEIMEEKETLLQKLEKFKVILSILVIVIPILASATYYMVDQILRASKFIEKLDGVDAAELANTLEWLELEILRIRHAEMVMQYESITEALNTQQTPDIVRILNDQKRNLTNAIRSNNERQNEIIQKHKERTKSR
jgi:hypothetical protein